MKGPMPPIELDEIPKEDLMKFSREELDKIPFTLVRWQCKIKMCKCYTRVRDYGIHPYYYSPRGVNNSEGGTSHWVDTYYRFMICGKHKKYFREPIENIPLKKNADGSIVHGWDETKKETIIW